MRVRPYIKHGGSRHPLYPTWNMMLQRCLNPDSRVYRNYGARGVTVCDRWRKSFYSFVSDMGPKPSPRHSLDRIDTFGPYAPENCRWATSMQQAANKRPRTGPPPYVRFITIRGVEVPRLLAARDAGIHPDTVAGRLKRGWSPEQAVSLPVGHRFKGRGADRLITRPA